MVFHKVLRWCPQVDNEFKEYERNFNFKIVLSHEIYVQNHTQPFAFKHHF